MRLNSTAIGKPEISTGHPQPNNKGKDMKDEYSELRAAFHAGARIQAWTLREFAKSSNDGYWRLLGDNQTHEEPKFSCEPHLYRVYPEDRRLIAELGQEVGAEQAPVAYMEPVTFNAASPADFAEALRKWPDDYDDWFPVYSSPAHTSEARDALMAWAVKNDVAAGECDPNRRVIPLAALNQYAAMRQEGE